MTDLQRRRLLAGGLAGGAWLLGGCGSDGLDGLNPPNGEPGPRGLHLSFTGDPKRTRTAVWFTDGIAAAPPQFMEYGPVTPGMDTRAIASAPFEAQVAADASPTPFVDAVTHRATASGIEVDRPLRYRVGRPGAWSPVAVVRPAPAEGEPFRFIHFGDHGRTQDSRHVARAIRARQADFVILAGDLSYASGSSSLGPQEVWDDWFDLVQTELGPETLLMTAPGNHENEGNNGVAYRNRMAMPRSTWSPDGTFYQFEFNRVVFLMSTGGAFATDGSLVTEIAWLETQLAQAALRRAAGQVDFIVVSQHFTLWTDQIGRAPANFTLVALQENILVRYGVDLVAVGHDHIYQRSHPMSFGLRNPVGYVQVTSGCGGVGIRSFEPNIQRWSAKELAEPLFVEYTVANGRMEGVTWGVDSVSGAIREVDRFELRRRDGLLVSAAVQTPRELASLHPNYDQLARQTAFRNRLLLQNCGGGVPLERLQMTVS